MQRAMQLGADVPGQGQDQQPQPHQQAQIGQAAAGLGALPPAAQPGQVPRPPSHQGNGNAPPAVPTSTATASTAAAQDYTANAAQRARLQELSSNLAHLPPRLSHDLHRVMNSTNAALNGSGSSGSSSSTHRRPRAGLDNPLVAFGNLQQQQQSTSASAQAQAQASAATQAQPSIQVTQSGEAEPSAKVSRPEAQADSASADTSTPLTTAGAAEDDRAAIRQRMEAAARARMGLRSPAPIAGDNSAATRSQATTAPAIAESTSQGSGSEADGQVNGQTSAAAGLPTISQGIQGGSMTTPRLIPLFDPSNPSQPSPYARFFPSLMRANLFPDLPGVSSSSSTSSQNLNQPSLSIPEDLTQDQLATLAEITKEGLETRLKLLSNTQETLNACMRQMQDAMNVLSGGDMQGVLKVVSELVQANHSAKGKGSASEDNR